MEEYDAYTLAYTAIEIVEMSTGNSDHELDELYALQTHLGYRLTEWEHKRSVVTLELQPFHMNRHGLPHGGIYATLLDTAMGYSGSFVEPGEPKRFALTLSMTCNFLSRPKGQLLLSEGIVTGGGKNTFFTEGNLMDETGELIATAVGTFRVRAAKA